MQAVHGQHRVGISATQTRPTQDRPDKENDEPRSRRRPQGGVAHSRRRGDHRGAMELSFACSSMTSSKKKKGVTATFHLFPTGKDVDVYVSFIMGFFRLKRELLLRFVAELTVVYHAVRFRYFRVRFNFNRLLDSRALAFARAGYALTPVSRTPGYPSSRSRRVRSRRPSA